MIKRILLAALLIVVGLPLAAQEKPDTPYNFALSTNLLRWATLTPDLGVEWRANRDLGILLNGSFTTWCWNQKERKYSLWEVNPELRWYIGKNRHGFLGAMGKVGSFNYKFSETGKQGNVVGGGITGGYQMPFAKSWMLELSLGLGYLYVDYDTYTVEDGVRVHQEQKYKDYWGPISVGVTLVWNIF